MKADSHLARIDAVKPAGRVLTLPWILASTLLIGLAPAIMTAIPLLLLGVLSILMPQLWSTWPIAAGVTGSGLLLAYWLAAYPEWPSNRCLHWRLARAVSRRPQEATLVTKEAPLRMAEWVPRENWTASRLETAADVALIEVDSRGVRMEGDQGRYLFPPESIIDVSVESIRPAGCFHQMHFAVIVARTLEGPQEYPIAYRDHGIATLSTESRKRDAMELCRQIASIARGGDFIYRDRSHEMPANPRRRSLNPFAAPQTI